MCWQFGVLLLQIKWSDRIAELVKLLRRTLFLSRHITAVVAPWTSSQLFHSSTNVEAILSCLSGGCSPFVKRHKTRISAHCLCFNLTNFTMSFLVVSCPTFQWPRDRPTPAAQLRCGRDLSAGCPAVQPCSVWSGDGSGLPLQKVLQNRTVAQTAKYSGPSFLYRAVLHHIMNMGLSHRSDDMSCGAWNIS